MSKPYFGKNSIQPDIQPDFSRPQKTSPKSSQSSRSFKSSQPSKSFLSLAENSALTSHQKSLTTPSFRYINSGKLKAKSFKKTPLLIFSSIVIFFLFTLTTFTSFLGIQIHDLITRISDTQFTSHAIRKPFLVKGLLKNTNQSEFSTLPKDLKQRFKKQGIEVGFTDSSGQFNIGDPPKGTSYTLKYRDKIATDISYQDIIKSDAMFLNTAKKSTRGRSASFFDPSASHHYRKLNLSRNDFTNYRQSNNQDSDNKAFRDVMNQKFSTDSDIRIGITEDQTTTDENGNTIKNRVTETDINTKNIPGNDATTKAKSYLDHLTNKTQGTSFACLGLKIGNMVSTAVNALETYQSINFFMGLSENISKVKAGFGSQSAIHPVMNFFHQSTENTVYDVKTNQSIKVKGSPLESESLKSILGNTSPNKDQVLNFSSERSNHALKNSPSLTSTSVKSCSANQTAGAIISLSAFAIPGGGIIKASVGLLKNTVFAIGAQIAIAGTLSVLIPTIAETMFSNRFANATGKPAGELFVKGAISANTKLARSGSGQTPSSKHTVLAFHTSTHQAIQEEITLAKLERHKPLDTFINHLTLKLSTIHSSSSISTLNNLTNLAKTSFVQNLENTTLAHGRSTENSSFMTTFGDCPNLESIGAVGDIHCNPIPTSDLSTSKVDPETDSKYLSIINQNLEKTPEGHQKIKDNSNLANFILYCAERDSPFGAIDANIHNAMQHSLGVVGDNLPILNDIIDIVNATEDIKNLPWATGAICVNSPQNPKWEEFKYYQRYIEDHRLLDQLGAHQDQKNPVLAFKDHYQSTHPLDTSPSGTLARITGLTKFDTEGLLAIQEYQNTLRRYQSTIAHQFSIKPIKTQYPVISTSNHQTPYKLLSFIKSPFVARVRTSEITS